MTTKNHTLTYKESGNTQPQIDRLLRWKDVQPLVGMCRSNAHKLIAEGKFPAQIRLVEGGRASAWLESEIREYIDQRVKASRSTDPEAVEGA